MKFPRVVYMLRNTITNKCYVGSTSNLECRLKFHLSSLKNGTHSVEDMQADFDEYGDHFQVFILDTILQFNDRIKEYEWMRKLSTNNRQFGYNYKDPTVREARKNAHYFFEYNGELRSIVELSKISGIKASVLRARLLYLKWDIEKAMSEKADARKYNKKKIHDSN